MIPPIDKDALIASLLERIEVLMAQNAALVARVVELEAKLGLPPKRFKAAVSLIKARLLGDSAVVSQDVV